jgi:hypothetical protein
MFTIRVPLDTGSGALKASTRPDSDHTAHLRRDGAYIDTERFEDPPDDYGVVSGEAHACDDCGALFDTQQAVAGHGRTHSEE